MPQLVAADIAVRVILHARDLKLGVATALVGAPLFFAPDLPHAEGRIMSLLTLTGFGVARRNHSILRGVDLVIGAGELVGAIGPNGAEKTTLMRAALGLIEKVRVIVQWPR